MLCLATKVGNYQPASEDILIQLGACNRPTVGQRRTSHNPKEEILTDSLSFTLAQTLEVWLRGVRYEDPPTQAGRDCGFRRSAMSVKAGMIPLAIWRRAVATASAMASSPISFLHESRRGVLPSELIGSTATRYPQPATGSSRDPGPHAQHSEQPALVERRGWDLNPRWVSPHTISNRADSAALAPLRGLIPGVLGYPLPLRPGAGRGGRVLRNRTP